jgi:hypothetical protein
MFIDLRARLAWQQRVARGGVLVGDEVTLVLDVSAVRVQE